MARISLLTLALILTCVYMVIAQEVTGNLEGRILDAQRNPIPGVTVTVTSPSLQGQRGISTGNDGMFHLLWLPSGMYTVQLSHVAYHSTTIDDVRIRLGRTTTIGDTVLQERTMEMAEVVVSGERPLLDPASTTIGTNLDRAATDPLPTDRDFRSIISLVPQANTSYLGDETNISGSTGFENMYFVDGINITDPDDGKTSTNLPYNFIREIQVKTGGYEAEFPSALGGIVNAVTQSGGNDVHGEVFGFYTGSSLSARGNQALLAGNVKDIQLYDIGLSIGGPIIRDRLWFFAAYNPSFEDKNVEIEGLGFFPDRRQSHRLAGKLTWQASPSTNFVLSILGDPASGDFVGVSGNLGWLYHGVTNVQNPDPLLRRTETGGVNGSLLARHMVNDRFFLEASVSRVNRKEYNDPRTGPGKSELMIVDYTSGTLSGGYPYSFQDHGSRTTAQIAASLLSGSHQVKAGFGFEDNALEVRYTPINDPTSPWAITRYDTAYYTAWYALREGTVHNRIPSVFLQDSWMATEKLRINAGLRWTAEFFIGSDGKLAQRITDEYQPRLGFTYQPGEPGKQKLFGSYGRYYEQMPLVLSQAFHAPTQINYTIDYDHDPRVDPSGGDTTYWNSEILPEVDGLEGQHFDEFTLGFEQKLGDDFKVGIRGIYRNLLQVVEDGYDTTGWSEYSEVGSVVGNPGVGDLGFLPKLTRQYKAVEITLQRSRRRGLNFLVSYVLSRNYGNYPGLYSSDYRAGNVNCSPYDTPEQAVNSDGLLPNDRPHVFKFSGSYHFDFGVSAGTSFIVQSGTPLNDFGQTILGEYVFLQPRGTVGRTPAIWDLNLRLTYDFSSFMGTALQPRLILDVFHLFGQRDVVDVDQVHYLGLDADGNQINPSPTYLTPILYQPPMSVRLGMEVTF